MASPWEAAPEEDWTNAAAAVSGRPLTQALAAPPPPELGDLSSWLAAIAPMALGVATKGKFKGKGKAGKPGARGKLPRVEPLAEAAPAVDEKPLFIQPPESEPQIRAQGLLPGSIGALGTTRTATVSERVRDAIANPEVKRQLKAFAKAKATYGKRWYNAKQLKDYFMAPEPDGLGPVEGEKWFNSFMDMMGAYSPLNMVVPNIRQASNAYRRVKSGEPLYEPYQEPSGKGPWHADPTTEEGYGSLATATHQNFLKQVMEGGGMDPVTNPKTPRFAEDLKGNFAPGAVDAIMLRLVGMASKDPRFLAKQARIEARDPKTGEYILNAKGKKTYVDLKPAQMFKEGRLTMAEALKDPNMWEKAPAETTEYPHLEKYFAGMAKELGMTPAQFQASVWLGGGKTAGLGSSDTLSFVEIFRDQVIRRAGLEGWTPRETLRKFIHGETALEMGAGLVIFSQLPALQQQAVREAAKDEGGT